MSCHSSSLARIDAPVLEPAFIKEMEAELQGFTNDSAMMIAYERALESKRNDALINDPYAALLQGSKGESLSVEFGNACWDFGFADWPDFHRMWTAVRTRFIDDQLSQSAASVSQFVNLGAGLDTRAFRLSCLQSIEAVYEVDMAAVNDFKEKILKKMNPPLLCPKTETVSIDFLDEDKSLGSELAMYGFNPAKPTLFLAEGLIQYLGCGKAKLLDDVKNLACAGSVFVLQYLDSSGQEGLGFCGLTEAELRERFGADWELEFLKFGEDGLNFGRYDTTQFQPNPMFSFMVARFTA